jgi:hypothetical protein
MRDKCHWLSRKREQHHFLGLSQDGIPSERPPAIFNLGIIILT